MKETKILNKLGIVNEPVPVRTIKQKMSHVGNHTFQLHSRVYSRLHTKLSEESTPLLLSSSEELPSHSSATRSTSPWTSFSVLRRTNGPQVATLIGMSPKSYYPRPHRWIRLLPPISTYFIIVVPSCYHNHNTTYIYTEMLNSCYSSCL